MQTPAPGRIYARPLHDHEERNREPKLRITEKGTKKMSKEFRSQVDDLGIDFIRKMLRYELRDLTDEDIEKLRAAEAADRAAAFERDKALRAWSHRDDRSVLREKLAEISTVGVRDVTALRIASRLATETDLPPKTIAGRAWDIAEALSDERHARWPHLGHPDK